VARNLITLVLLAAAFGCVAQQPWSFNLGDFLAAKELPYDSPPQVIYRMDDHRFVTLEHYLDCNHGDTFYNDTEKNIRRRIGRGRFENFQGKVINADPSGSNLAFPLAYPPHLVCGDRGCTVLLRYSTDGGETFNSLPYMPPSFNPYRDSKDYVISVSKDAIYITRKLGDTIDRTSTDKYPLTPGFVYSPKQKSPDGKHVEFDVSAPVGLTTPSGQDRISCDPSIKPTNPDAPIVRERQ
jgi:hypothetical protein